jgi:tetratricopeptide (TPR) repeat protein
LRKAVLFFYCGVLFLGCNTSWAEQPTAAKWLQQRNKSTPVLEIYQKLLKETPDSLGALDRLKQVLLEQRRYDDLVWLADILVDKGELDKARELLQILTERLPKQAGTLRLKIAEIYCFQGKFQQMLDLCQQLVRGEAAENYINDALEKMVLVRENLNSPEALKLFTTAELLLRQQKYNQALKQIEQLRAGFTESALSDDLLLLESRLRDEMGNFQPALDVLRRLLSEYPQSPLCAEAQKRLGEIYEKRLQDYQSAEREYRLFLLHYPESVLASEVRGKLQSLRTREAKPVL